MFELNLKGIANILTEEQLEDLAAKTDGFSGSNISTLTQEAIFEPVKNAKMPIFSKKFLELMEFNGIMFFAMEMSQAL